MLWKYCFLFVGCLHFVVCLAMQKISWFYPICLILPLLPVLLESYTKYPCPIQFCGDFRLCFLLVILLQWKYSEDEVSLVIVNYILDIVLICCIVSGFCFLPLSNNIIYCRKMLSYLNSNAISHLSVFGSSHNHSAPQTFSGRFHWGKLKFPTFVSFRQNKGFVQLVFWYSSVRGVLLSWIPQSFHFSAILGASNCPVTLHTLNIAAFSYSFPCPYISD